MAITTSITEILNQWAAMGVFSYVFPFLLIFAVVFGILQKAKIFGEAEKTKGINAIIALAVGFLSLQFDLVSTFFATIFPRFGVGLAVFLVLIIAIGFFYNPGNDKDKSKVVWIGFVVGIGVVIWAITNWNFWMSGNYNISWWLQEYFWPLIILAVVIGGIIAIVRSGDKG